MLSGSALVLGSMHAVAPDDQAKMEDMLKKSAAIIRELTNSSTSVNIPHNVLETAKCIAVVPGMLTASETGGLHGSGVATCKLTGGKWSAPAAFELAGGTIGWKTRPDSYDLVLMITGDDAVKSLDSGHFTIGGDVATTAGPVGRGASAPTDSQAPILIYARAKDAYAEVSIQGAVLTQDDNVTDALYGKDSEGQNTNFADILNGAASATYHPAVGRFLATIQKAEAKAQ